MMTAVPPLAVAFDEKDGEPRVHIRVEDVPQWDAPQHAMATLGTAMRLDAVIHLLMARGLFTEKELRGAIATSHRERLGRVLQLLASTEQDWPAEEARAA